MNIIEDKINLLWEGIIKNFSFNAPMHKLNFNIRKIHEGKKEDFLVTISEISFYLFYDHNASRDKNYEWENTELSTFFYASNKIKSHKNISDSYNEGKSFDIDYNLSLELWEADLLIKANKIKINDEEFYLE
ncbi:MAG: hypothetical protein GY830_09170 [Bacteroidetes bacterium]|nr:hypothetical protein [Bacteroidota bacterium]